MVTANTASPFRRASSTATPGVLDELSIDEEEMIKLKPGEAASWQRGAADLDETAALEDLERQGVTLGPLPEELPAKALEAVAEFVRGSELVTEDAIVEAVLAYVG